MNRGVVQSSPVQQMMAGNPNIWWNINTMRPPNSHIHHQPSAPFFSTPPSNFLTPYPPTPSSLPLPSWHDNQGLPADSWSQLLMSGGVLLSEEDKGGMCQQQEQIMLSQPPNADPLVDVVKQESYIYGRNQEFLQAKPTWSQIVPPPPASSSPKSSTTVTSFNSSGSMLDFSNNKTDTRSPPSDPISNSECNSGAAGGAFKKARVQPSTTQSTFKVRREKLGDRITALHQLVSPFGKTDTASVLLEAIGYIRFLQSQIEALSLPYLGSGSGNMRHQQSVQGEKNCLFPEDPGQLLNENCLKRKAASKQDSEEEEEEKKDLRSRGLCLVPVSCTLQVGSDNGADYWAPAFGGGFQ